MGRWLHRQTATWVNNSDEKPCACISIETGKSHHQEKKMKTGKRWLYEILAENRSSKLNFILQNTIHESKFSLTCKDGTFTCTAESKTWFF